MSKRKTIDAFFKKKDISNSKIRTVVTVQTNVDISMLDEHPSKCSRIQSEEINHDPGSCKQICEFSINKQDEIWRAYLKEGSHQPKNIDYPYNDDTHRRRFQPSNWHPHIQIPGYALTLLQVLCKTTCLVHPSFVSLMPYTPNQDSKKLYWLPILNPPSA